MVAVAVGLALGWIANRLMGLLGDATLQIGLTLLVPFVAYVVAEELQGSGVLAVLTTALFLAEYASDADDVLGAARRAHLLGGRRHAGHRRRLRADRAGAAQRVRHGRGPVGRDGSGGRRPSSRWWSAYGWCGCCRPRWLAKRLHQRRDYDEEIPLSWRETVVMWWAGMRGVASVALALAIPLQTDDGEPFPGRDEIVFIAFAVIMATLVLPGADPAVAGAAAGGARPTRTPSGTLERQLAIRAAKAAKRRLKEIEEVEDLPEDLVERLLRRAYDIGARISPDMVDDERREAYEQRVRRLQPDPADPAGDDVGRPPRGAGRAQRARRDPRSWTGCCGIWMCVVCGELSGAGCGG